MFPSDDDIRKMLVYQELREELKAHKENLDHRFASNDKKDGALFEDLTEVRGKLLEKCAWQDNDTAEMFRKATIEFLVISAIAAITATVLIAKFRKHRKAIFGAVALTGSSLIEAWLARGGELKYGERSFRHLDTLVRFVRKKQFKDLKTFAEEFPDHAKVSPVVLGLYENAQFASSFGSVLSDKYSN
ncbi:MAG: hypothetical protein JSR80_02625 [Verrucomicrobia bacterium]|nr:hypothetical protein [Verrucomicrobiota bacterium]